MSGQPRNALVRPGTGVYVQDLLLLELPHIPEERRVDILWEYTGWPHFWDYQGEEWYPTQTLRRQLVEFREGRAKTTGEMYDEAFPNSVRSSSPHTETP